MSGALQISLHAAKGLEFPVVFLVGLEEGIFPHSRALADPTEMQEERRLAYVGLTRAKEFLHLTYAQSRALFGMRSANPISRFIIDVPEDLVATTPAVASWGIPRSASYQSSDSARGARATNANQTPPINYTIGDQVTHATFGEGVVLKLEHNLVEVDFTFSGRKRLDPSFARLVKST